MKKFIQKKKKKKKWKEEEKRKILTCMKSFLQFLDRQSRQDKTRQDKTRQDDPPQYNAVFNNVPGEVVRSLKAIEK